MKWYDTSFTPTGCNKQINGPAVTVGAGHVWGEVYAEARRKGLSVVGGYSDTVGIAGFLSNGGHGEMTAKYGFGADMVLQIDLVTADGRYISANECQNSDIFWAMRGVGLPWLFQAIDISTNTR
jgi:FAD/FMN-containing dehydrogenase